MQIPQLNIKAQTFQSKYGVVKILPKNKDVPFIGEPDWSELQKAGIVRSKPHQLSGYVSPSGAYKIKSFEEVDQDVLEFQKKGRMAASAAAVGLNTLASLGLLVSGGALLSNTIRGGDTEGAYSWIGKTFGLAAAAGAATGIAQESKYWLAGNLGMGIFSNFLDKMWGLPLFAISDGLSSIGMGQVRYRQERNALSVQNSIFNNPKLRSFKFLQPVEQSLINFFKLCKSPVKTLKEEPYSLFNSTGGGLISAGGVLGIASMLTGFMKDRIPEKIQSLPYLLYSVMSGLNLVALYRDGERASWKANQLLGNKKGQQYSQYAEGFLKRLAVPFLAMNNILLLGKGIGLDNSDSSLFNGANAFRSIGAAFAMVAFGFQSLFNFFKPIRFGPDRKENVTIEINPNKAQEALFNHIETLKNQKPGSRYTPLDSVTAQELEDVIRKDKYGEIFLKISELKLFKRLEELSQAGLPSPSNPYADKRAFLDRWTHSMQVLAVGILMYDGLLEKARENNDIELINYLEENELACKLYCQLHDIGHTARSHVTEKAIVGQDNDEYTKMLLMNSGNTDPEIHDFLIRTCGEKVVNQVLELASRKHPLYKLAKDADRYQYQLLGDFITIENPRIKMPVGSPEGAKALGKEVRFFKKDGSYHIGYTEDAALQKLSREYNRLIFDVVFNNNVIAYTEADLLYAVGLSAYLSSHKEVTSDDIKKRSQDEVDKMALEGLKSLGNSNFNVEVELLCGGEAYSGYDPEDPKNIIYCVTQGKTQEITLRLQEHIKKSNPDLYKFFEPMVKVLTRPREVRVNAEISNSFNFSKEIQPAKIKFRAARAEAA